MLKADPGHMKILLCQTGQHYIFCGCFFVCLFDLFWVLVGFDFLVFNQDFHKQNPCGCMIFVTFISVWAGMQKLRGRAHYSLQEFFFFHVSLSISELNSGQPALQQVCLPSEPSWKPRSIESKERHSENGVARKARCEVLQDTTWFPFLSHKGWYTMAL